MFEVQPGADGRALRLNGELDLSTVVEFTGRVESRIREGWGDLVLDLLSASSFPNVVIRPADALSVARRTRGMCAGRCWLAFEAALGLGSPPTTGEGKTCGGSHRSCSSADS